jgi:hypothetical protein
VMGSLFGSGSSRAWRACCEGLRWVLEGYLHSGRMGNSLVELVEGFETGGKDSGAFNEVIRQSANHYSQGTIKNLETLNSY